MRQGRSARRKSQQASTAAAQRPDSPPEAGAGWYQQRGRGGAGTDRHNATKTCNRACMCNRCVSYKETDISSLSYFTLTLTALTV